nr:MAG TPA: hypothetical protein [Caudoviricetes sp.]
MKGITMSDFTQPNPTSPTNPPTQPSVVTEDKISYTEETVNELLRQVADKYPLQFMDVKKKADTLIENVSMIKNSNPYFVCVKYLNEELAQLERFAQRAMETHGESKKLTALGLLRQLDYISKLKTEEIDREMLLVYLNNYYSMYSDSQHLVKPELWLSLPSFNFYIELRSKCSPTSVKKPDFPLSLYSLLEKPLGDVQYLDSASIKRDEQPCRTSAADGNKLQEEIDSFIHNYLIDCQFSIAVINAARQVNFRKELDLKRYAKYNNNQRRKAKGISMPHDALYAEYKKLTAEKKQLDMEYKSRISAAWNAYKRQEELDLLDTDFSEL